MQTQIDTTALPTILLPVFLDPETPVDPARALVPTGGDLAAADQTQDRDDQSRWLAWLAARDAWLAAKQRKTGSAATVRAYTYAWDDIFLRFLPTHAGRPIGPWQVGKREITAYQQSLENTIIAPGQRNAGQPLAPTTVNARLAAISSYYSYCQTTYTIIVQGREIPLAHHNPAKAVERAKTTPYEKSHALDPDQTRLLLTAINRNCLRGQRDYALILTYLYTGRRAAEIAGLRWSDIGAERGHTYYHWRGKGGKTRRDELPPPAYQAILDYLKFAGRLETIQPHNYIWIPLSTNAARLPNVDPDYDPAAQPISTGMVNRIVKNRARRAGLDPDPIHTHILRHTAAMLRREAGDDIQAIQQFLNHSNLAVTQIYLQSHETRRDTSWTGVQALLGGN